MYVVLLALSIIPLLVSFQAVRIYFGDGPDLRARGERQASSMQVIPAMRGAILDRAGRVLAVNAARYDLGLDPTSEGFTDAVRTKFVRSLAPHGYARYRDQAEAARAFEPPVCASGARVE